jgi:Rha family phage regulatory protein
MADLPALCHELGIHPGDGVPVVNSRDVARVFEKRHDNVLRDIGSLLTTSDLRASNWFHPVNYLDTKGEERRSFDLTRQGFTLLVMGWNGERAMAFKVRYIEAFDAMESALKSSVAPADEKFLQAVREIVAPLAVRFAGQDEAKRCLRQPLIFTHDMHGTTNRGGEYVMGRINADNHQFAEPAARKAK